MPLVSLLSVLAFVLLMLRSQLSLELTEALHLATLSLHPPGQCGNLHIDLPMPALHLARQQLYGPQNCVDFMSSLCISVLECTGMHGALPAKVLQRNSVQPPSLSQSPPNSNAINSAHG